MPKIAKPLTALEVKRLTVPGLHAVGTVSGLCLFVKPTGARSWVLRTMIGTRRAELGLGGYPTVSLAQAIDYAREALQKIRGGTDPAAERRSKRVTVEWTFKEAVPKQYLYTMAYGGFCPLPAASGSYLSGVRSIAPPLSTKPR